MKYMRKDVFSMRHKGTRNESDSIKKRRKKGRKKKGGYVNACWGVTT